MANFCFKLKNMKRPMKSLCKENYSDIEKCVFEASNELKSYKLLTLQDPSPSNVHNEVAARSYWLVLHHAEESYFRQRSRIKWLAEGDFNTSFFHFITKLRNAFTAVKYIVRSDGSRAVTTKDIHEYAVDFYKEILGQVRGQFCPELPYFLLSQSLPICTPANLLVLNALVIMDLIKVSLDRIPANKTLGPNSPTA